jgi:Leucine-rich repeat (LRR) protein
METLEQLINLDDLNIANTPVSDLNDIGNLEQLKKLNCSGTQIKRLDPLENLSKLEQLDCSNTFVSKLDALENLPMTLLKCYNTKISSKTVDKFKKNVPGCEVIYYR